MFLGTASYLLAAAAFLVLTVLLAIGWQGRSPGARCITAAFITAIWAVVLALQAQAEHFPAVVVFVAELLRDGAWLWVLLALTAPILSRPVRIAIPAVWMLMLLAGMLLPFLARQGVEFEQPMLLLSRCGLVIALAALVLIEHLYRSATSDARRGLRYFVFGVGGLFAYDLFLYSQAELLRGLSGDAWYARGVVDALLV